MIKRCVIAFGKIYLHYLSAGSDHISYSILMTLDYLWQS